MKNDETDRYAPGSKVLVRENPHHPAAVDIVGTAVAYRRRTGFAGCDLVDVRYEDPQDGRVHGRPFEPSLLLPASRHALEEAAARCEAMAAELRRLAEQ